MAEQTEQVQGLIRSVRNIGAHIHSLKEIASQFPNFREQTDDLRLQLEARREAEFAMLGRDTFVRLAGSVENERR
jgi:hypothetical protein